MCEELDLKVQYMHTLVVKVKKFCAGVAELIELPKTNASKVRAKPKIADVEVVPKQARTECSENMARTAQFKGDFNELMSKIDFWIVVITSLICGIFC